MVRGFPTLERRRWQSAQSDLYEKAIALSAQSMDENFLDLGKALRQLLDRDPDLFKRWWTRRPWFAQSILSGQHQPIVEAAANPAQPVGDRLDQAGENRQHVTKSNWQELLQLAEANNTKQIEALMKGEKPQTNAHCFLAYLDPKDYKLLEGGLVHHGTGAVVGAFCTRKPP